ncbi:DUF38 domain-containing protein [Caenorhabditis elegans]|uniref:DUF38 domain-containing protein n=1 Tax=Caenorhabditis elegans TaxID=6239 RepID=D9N150_CAEEL|nr:DUF38 domain-containing protein [Caenorhabditis elegans]CBO24680.1 DUF38 domain-containing protein [Caenorhabditis elegans]|eukprot:NP_001256751.1 Uncharacterized protein CELE_F57G4.11 [Caenorhabditis elegans]
MDQIQKYPIVEVYITVENNRISATYMLYYKADRKPVTLTYHNCSLGCQRVHDQMEELLENQDFMKLSIEDLSTSLAMNNVLSFLSITFYGESSPLPNDDISISFLNDLKEMLQTRDNSLVVNEITISFRSVTIRRYIISIVKSCHPEIFKTFKVSVIAENENRSMEKTFNIEGLFELDHVENQFLTVENEVSFGFDCCDVDTNLCTYTLTFSDEMSADQPVLESQASTKNDPSIMNKLIDLTSYLTKPFLNILQSNFNYMLNGNWFYPKLTRIDIDIEPREITIRCFQESHSFYVTFYENSSGCIIKVPEPPFNSALVPAERCSKENFIICFIRHFEYLLKRQQFEIQTFQCSFNHTIEVSKTLDKVNKSIISNHLSVENLILKGGDFFKVLSCFDANKLQNLKFESNDCQLDLRKITSLLQWKHARGVFIKKCAVSMSMRDFSHFSNVDVHLEFGSVEDILFLKKKFLESNTRQIYKFTCDSFPVARLLDEFGAPCVVSKTKISEDQKWIFNTPDTLKTVLILSARSVFGKETIIELFHESSSIACV